MTAVAFRRFRLFRMGPATRVSLGLSSLTVSCLLVVNLCFGLPPAPDTLLRELRERISENLAVHTAALMQSGDVQSLTKIVQQALTRNTQMRSVAIRRDDGQIVAKAGDHARHWVAPAKGLSDIDHVQVPLFMGHQRWGDVEISFQPIAPQTVWEWLHQPSVVLVAILGLFSFMAFSLYLRRVLDYLDPSAVIPDRVRAAFDAFAEGVMVVDTAGRIVLANAAFRCWVERPSANLYGQRIQNLPWLRNVLPGHSSDYPWMRAMAQAAPQKGEQLEFPQERGDSIKTVVNCAPIQDARGKVRGCIVTFDDVSEIEQINRHLRETMADLERSREQIEKQNRELRDLATRDPLTGCLNRRALFESLDKLFADARDGNQPLSCIMTDIDHFKSFNDRYGHAVGDAVLKAVSRNLLAGLRDADLLCRYGGEEFCIVLPGVDREDACRIAERLRVEIEHRAGRSVRTTQGIVVTSSFGVSALHPTTMNPADLIDQADQALYAAKVGGRNCVRNGQVEETVA
jgi:diguanylate cyclase (GGDEF)-like protein/PAS domain S-box-containing protein